MLQSLATKADNLSNFGETKCPLAPATWLRRGFSQVEARDHDQAENEKCPAFGPLTPRRGIAEGQSPLIDFAQPAPSEGDHVSDRQDIGYFTGRTSTSL